jgi:hypothetical protein
MATGTAPTRNPSALPSSLGQQRILRSFIILSRDNSGVTWAATFSSSSVMLAGGEAGERTKTHEFGMTAGHHHPVTPARADERAYGAHEPITGKCVLKPSVLGRGTGRLSVSVQRLYTPVLVHYGRMAGAPLVGRTFYVAYSPARRGPVRHCLCVLLSRSRIRGHGAAPEVAARFIHPRQPLPIQVLDRLDRRH